MKEIRLDELLEKIHEEILKRAGKGFTIEINAEITKYEIYKRKAPPFSFFSEGQWTWKYYQSKTDEKYISKFQRRIDDVYYFDRIESVDMDVSISREVEKQLPKGIGIHKTASKVLYDGRDYFLKDPPGAEKFVHIRKLEEERKKYGRALTSTKEKDGHKTEYIEGRRVYLTVTDEYAARIFDEVCDSQYPFRNLLLTKYDYILKEIAMTWGYPLHGWSKEELYFEVISSKINLRDTYDEDGMYNWKTIFLKTWGMKNLTSHEQIYGMAIAIIDTMKAKYPELDQVKYTIESDMDSVRVHGVIPPQPIAQTADELKEW